MEDDVRASGATFPEQTDGVEQPDMSLLEIRAWDGRIWRLRNVRKNEGGLNMEYYRFEAEAISSH
jgi:hypothetical protein